MKLLFLFSGYFSLHFQILKHNYTCLILCGIFRDLRSYFAGQLHIQPFCIIPSALDLSGGMFPLKTADSAKHMIQMVFITGEIYKFTSQDSAICPHDAADCIRIDSQINTAYHLLFYSCFR